MTIPKLKMLTLTFCSGGSASRSFCVNISGAVTIIYSSGACYILCSVWLYLADSKPSGACYIWCSVWLYLQIQSQKLSPIKNNFKNNVGSTDVTMNDRCGLFVQVIENTSYIAEDGSHHKFTETFKRISCTQIHPASLTQ